MNRFLKSAVVALTALIGAWPGAAAAETAETPIATFHSSAFATYGSSNKFHFLIGGRAGAYIDVDCGYGPVEVELKPAYVENGALTGTIVTCSVNEAGTVKIYGDAADIDYLEAEGCYLRAVDISQLTELTGLDLDHNELTGLDLTPHTKLQSLSLSDNPFSAESPLKIGANKPELMILDMSITKWIDPSFNLSDYPAMYSFDAFSCETLTQLDPTGCPNLMRLTADVTPIQSIDVTHNPKLQILNVSDTRVTSIDVSQNPLLTQLFCSHDSYMHKSYKLTALDVTHNPQLIYLFCGGNELSSLDLSKNAQLMDISAAHNKLSGINLDANPLLINVNIAYNDMGFATMPMPTDNWSDYKYKQNDTWVKPCMRVGDVIDLRSKMMRSDSETTAVLMKKNEEDFSAPLAVDPSLYSYENGIITLKAEITDSVFVSYTNDRFADCSLNTTHFVVKTAEKYGEDNVAVNMLPASEQGDSISFRIRTSGKPSMKGASNKPKFDFGDNTAAELAGLEPDAQGYYNVQAVRTGGGYVRVLLPEGVRATSFIIEGQELYSLNLSGAPELSELVVKGAGLYSFDLAKHRCLETLHLEGNNLSQMSLKAKNFNFAKTLLTTLTLRNNKIATFETDGLEGIQNLDLSHNNLTELTLETATKASNIDVSYNKLTEANLLKCDGLQRIDISHNNISSIIMPEIAVPVAMNASYNNLNPATLPATSTFAESYVYAPQNAVAIPAKGPGVDLSATYCTVDGATTQYAWFKADGTALTPNAQYTVQNGVTRFTDSSVGQVYGEITHAAFPDFTAENAIRTTLINVLPMPSKQIARFTTTTDGQNVRVALAAKQPGTMVMFDWNGDGSSMALYELGTSYSEYFATTKAGADVKVLAYDDSAPLTVFSLTGASMADIDVSQLSEVSTLNIGKAGLTSIQLPAPGKLTELFLDGNNLTNGFDLSAYKEIYYLSLNENQFEGEFDFSVLPNLQIASVAANKLTSVKFNNRKMWGLDLARNEFETISLNGAPALEQVALSNNKLSSIDFGNVNTLKSLFIDRNRFTFSTLPSTDKVSILYVYGNQAKLNVTPSNMAIDLSAEASVGSQLTTYRWFIDEISQDEEGNYIGEELVANEEYTVANGVTTFASPFQRVLGLMTNPAFPDLTLFTEMTDITPSGITDATTDNDAPVSYYDLQGRRVVNPATGFYIKRQGNTATKVYVK